MKKLILVVAMASSAAFAADAKKFELKGEAAKGEAKFKELCVSCHGEKGDGTGPAAAALTPKPANFTDAKRAAEATDEYIYNMIKEGGAANGKSPMMVAWKGSLNDQQIRDVAAYVRAFAPAAAAPAKAEKPADKKPAPKAKK